MGYILAYLKNLIVCGVSALKNSRKNIVLVMQGSRQWIGGIEYIRNCFKSLMAYKQESGMDLKVDLCIRGDLDPSFYEDLVSQANSVTKISGESLAFLKFILQNKSSFFYPYMRHKYWMPKVASAAWIPDFQHKYLEKIFAQKEIYFRDKLYQGIANFSQNLVLSSEAAEKDFKKFYPNTPIKTSVLRFRNAVRKEIYEKDFLDIQKKYHLPRFYFHVANQWWTHKNHKLLLEALAILKQEGRLEDILLVWTGHPYDTRDAGYVDEVFQRINSLGLYAAVRVLGLIPRQDQLQIMRASVAVIQPSSFEGWSTVIEDARCFDKKILASSIAVHKEQLGDSAMLFAQDSPQELASLMQNIWTVRENILADLSKKESLAKDRNEREVLDFGKALYELSQSR